MKQGLRILSLLMLPLLLLPLFCACRVQDPEEVQQGARELFSQMQALNNVLFGAGMAYEEDGAGYYRKVTEEAKQALGIADYDGLCDLCRKLFSTEEYEIVSRTVLQDQKDANGRLLSRARYYQYGEDLMVLLDEGQSGAEGLRIGGVNLYDLSTLQVVSTDRRGGTVRMDVTVIEGDQVYVEKAVSFRVVLEEGLWKLDSLPFVAFDPDFSE